MGPSGSGQVQLYSGLTSLWFLNVFWLLFVFAEAKELELKEKAL